MFPILKILIFWIGNWYHNANLNQVQPQSDFNSISNVGKIETLLFFACLNFSQ
jgi:hypothetical protein